MSANGLHRATRPFHALLLGATLACAPDVPDEPTWEDDVRPILFAQCVRCHSDTPRGGAPDTFRLDVYSRAEDEGQDKLGACQMRDRFDDRVAATREEDRMPPRGTELSDRQIRILVLWSTVDLSDCPIENGNGGER